MGNIFYSATENAFYDKSMIDAYMRAGSWPDDAVNIEDDVYFEFCNKPPEGKIRGSDSNGNPAWIDIETPSNVELLSNELSSLANDYKSDIYELNMAYVAAIVNDGPSEAVKVAAVRDEISARKAKYMADIAAARAQYPVE